MPLLYSAKYYSFKTKFSKKNTNSYMASVDRNDELSTIENFQNINSSTGLTQTPVYSELMLILVVYNLHLTTCTRCTLTD